jgi:FtsP/CotA-like multicopper oxidase with cupredoxin domain
MMYASRSLVVVFAIAASTGRLLARRSPCDSAPAGALVPSRDLYCLSLVPTPDIQGVSGRVELGRAAGPFTIAVTPDGRIRYAPTIDLSGLPAPSILGRYTTYVAWLATPVMYPVVRLGIVRNGATRLPEIALDKFVVLVTAERSARATQPTGRVVLRGESPSSRLQPPDLMRFAIGAAGAPSGADSEPMKHMNHHVSMQSSPNSVRWTTVPMPANLTMLPGEMALKPNVAPYLPPGGSTAPAARPHEIVRLRDGDTLRLTAGLVSRTFKGHRVTMFGFNGQYPGPLISVAQQATIFVDLDNELDQPTSIHWHGIRLDNRFDGVPGFTQEPVAPGGHFLYRVRFPDAGIYWYHPHVREDTQQELGLYGNLFVHSPRREYFGPANHEETLILDDLLIGEDGQLVPLGKDQTTHAFMGRFGNLFLVNGETAWQTTVQRGEVVRFLFTNVSNTRTLNLSFPGARMKVVGSDAGNYEHEQWVESVVIAPAERYIVHVRFDKTGDVALVNRVQGLDHLFGKFFSETDTLGMVHVGTVPAKPDFGTAFATLRTDTAARGDIERFRPYFDKPLDHSLLLTIEAHNLPFVSRQLMMLDSAYFLPIEWTGTMPMMNWASTSDQIRWVLRDPDTGKENMDIDWRFQRGDVVKLRLANERRSMHAMQHPIHLHGQRFLVLAVNGVRNDNLVWKDTVLIPAGSTVDLLVDMANPGRWMLHCHIAEHLSSGMMAAFSVQ